MATQSALTAENRFDSFAKKMKKYETADDVKELVEALQNAPDGTEYVKLGGNSYSKEAIAAIAPVIASRFSLLKHADFEDMFTTRTTDQIVPAIQNLCSSISGKSSMKVFEISGNALGKPGAEAVADFLLKTPSLTTIVLNNTGLSPDGATVVGDAIAQEKNMSLEEFRANRSRLENQGMRHLAPAFAKLSNLREVDVSQDGIKPDGIALLAESLKKCTLLEYLNVNDNAVKEEGAKAIGELMKSAFELKYLNLGCSLLGNEGLEHISAALGEGACPKLQTLDLCFNDIETEAAESLAKALRDSDRTALQHLELNGNCIKAAAIASIKEALISEDVLGNMSDNDDSDEESDEDADDFGLGDEMEKLTV